MKTIALLFFILPFSSMLPQEPGTLFSLMCDEQYNRDMRDIITQFSGFNNEETLNVYNNYMLLLKEHADLGYTMTPIEIALTSDQRARLRTPLQHYVNCRITFTVAQNINLFALTATQQDLTPCEQTYAFELQAALTYYVPTETPATLRTYQDLMVMLKRHQDLTFIIQDFESRVSFDVFSKLRLPLHKYNNCKDALIRTFTPSFTGSYTF